MSGEPKLLTEAEAAKIADLQWPSAIVSELRERGLIAPETAQHLYLLLSTKPTPLGSVSQPGDF